MKKNFTSFLLLIVVLAWSQNSYDFTQFEDEYQSIQNATELTDGTIWLNLEQDIPLGFDFQLFGDAHPQISMDGLLGNGMLFGYDESLLEYHLMIPMGTVLMDAAIDYSASNVGAAGSMSDVRYLIEGETGNRIAKFEFENLGFYYETYLNAVNGIEAPISTTNYQVWIYEVDNSIEYRYGTTNIVNASFAYGGAIGPFVALSPNLYILENQAVFSDQTLWLEGMPEAPEPQYGSTPKFLSLPPVSGTVYRFTPTSMAMQDVARQDWSIVPNPVSNVFEIRGLEVKTVQCFDALGRLVLSWNHNGSYDVSKLAQGIYFITIQTTDGQKFSHKIIKK